MERTELVDRLKKLNIPTTQIEKEIGFSKNNLGKYFKEPELITDQLAARLEKYLQQKEQASI